MADTAVQRMTADAFLQWCLTEEGRWELVNGIPVPLHGAEMMSGAKRVHDLITGNIFAGLHARLKGGPCRPYTADFAVRTGPKQSVRRPDVLVECAKGAMNDLAAVEPAVAIEVLSPSNATVTRFAKVEEYKALATMRHVVVVEPGRPLLIVYSRAANDAWTAMEVEGLDALLPLPGVGAELPMAEIYADVVFEG